MTIAASFANNLYSPYYANVFNEHADHRGLPQNQYNAPQREMAVPQTEPTLDVLRDTPVRYIGFTNEVTEATKSVVVPKFPIWNKLGWAATLSYTAADIWHKGHLGYQSAKKEAQDNPQTSRYFIAANTISESLKAGLFQGVATDLAPIFVVIRPLEKIVHKLLEHLKAQGKHWVTQPVLRWVPVMAGLASIPFAPLVFDPLAEKCLEHGFNKVADPLLARLQT